MTISVAHLPHHAVRMGKGVYICATCMVRWPCAIVQQQVAQAAKSGSQ